MNKTKKRACVFRRDIMGSTNEKAKQFWSGEGGDFWVENQEELDVTLEPLGRAALTNIDLSSCASVLDIGCGTGRTTIEIAKKLAANGKATGLDISKPMLKKAKMHAQAEGVENVSFDCVDAQVESLGDAVFDAAFSRFGVMFFEDSMEAFSNIQGALKEDAPLSFVCWQSPASNPWHARAMEVVTQYIDIPRPPRRSPSPFAFEERDYVEEILVAAKFRKIEIMPFEKKIVWFNGKDPHRAASSYLSINPIVSEGLAALDDEGKEKILAGLANLFSLNQIDGQIMFDSATWIVSAIK